MRLSTKGKYALIAMAYIARKDFNSKVSVTEISSKLGISQTYLEQLFILQKYVRGGSYQLSLERPIKRFKNSFERFRQLGLLVFWHDTALPMRAFWTLQGLRRQKPTKLQRDLSCLTLGGMNFVYEFSPIAKLDMNVLVILRCNCGQGIALPHRFKLNATPLGFVLEGFANHAHPIARHWYDLNVRMMLRALGSHAPFDNQSLFVVGCKKFLQRPLVPLRFFHD